MTDNHTPRCSARSEDATNGSLLQESDEVCRTCHGTKVVVALWHVTRPGEQPLTVRCPDCSMYSGEQVAT